VETFTAQQVSSVLHAKEGTEIKLAVERDAVLSTIAVKTRTLLCAHTTNPTPKADGRIDNRPAYGAANPIVYAHRGADDVALRSP
jgi:hypothetical protein